MNSQGIKGTYRQAMTGFDMDLKCAYCEKDLGKFPEDPCVEGTPRQLIQLSCHVYAGRQHSKSTFTPDWKSSPGAATTSSPMILVICQEQGSYVLPALHL